MASRYSAASGLVADEAQEPDVLVQLAAVHGPPQRRVLADLVADDEQLGVGQRPRPHQREGLDQPLDVLVRPDVAHVQHERVVQLEALLDARDVLGGGHAVEALVDGVVGHGDLVGRDAEEAQDVALGGLRDRQHVRGPVCGGPHERRARRCRPAGWAGTAGTSGGCSRGWSPPRGSDSSGGST